MSQRAVVWVSLAYALLACGFIVAIVVIQRHTDQIDKTAKLALADAQLAKSNASALRVQARELRNAAGLFCQVSLQPDSKEHAALDLVARGHTLPLSPVCKRIVSLFTPPSQAPGSSG